MSKAKIPVDTKSQKYDGNAYQQAKNVLKS